MKLIDKMKLNKKIKDFKKEVHELKKGHPLYDPFCEIEYQLDIERVVVLLSRPYENVEDSDEDIEFIFNINVDEVYDFVKGIDNDCKHIIISDTTHGDYKHNDTLENTLKEYSEYFKIYCGSREWETKEQL